MHRDRKNIRFFYFFVDLILIAFSFYLPYCLRHNPGFSFCFGLPHSQEYFSIFLIWGTFLLFFLHKYKLYSTDRSLTIPKEFWQVIKAIFFSAIVAGLGIFLLQTKMFSRLVFGWAAILLIFSLTFWRVIKRILIRRRLAKGYYNTNVLIVGAGKAGRVLVKEIENHPYLGLKVIGFLDDAKKAKVLSYDILGKIDSLEYLVRHYYIDQIYVTIPSERRKSASILALAKKLNVTVRVLADNFIYSSVIGPEERNAIGLPDFIFPSGQVRFGHIGFVPLINYVDAGIHGSEKVFKRFFDLLASGAGLLLLLPLFAIIAFLIKLDGRGPVFYKSLRCGKKGKLFNFYKFRSMVYNADSQKENLRCKSEVEGPIFKIKDDPRITKIGKILRRYSLDELPQLINVFKGQMSLVGPRPPTPDEVANYHSWQKRRLNVKPGITCLWQVRGRSDLTFYKWMKWDLWYIDNWSFRLDLQILLWTIPAVFKKRGAY
jgi:exopolysaccharide biosynthesis polyprenyl glycosylphosphotransferase